MRSINATLFYIAGAAFSTAVAFAVLGLSAWIVRFAWDSLFLWATRP